MEIPSNKYNDGIRKIIEVLQGFLEKEDQFFNIYGFDPGFDSETHINFLRNQISDLSNDLSEVATAVNELQNVIKPDETDVHNINRRIELLAQRVAIIESKKGWFK
jgi:hypothetical protein